MTRIDAAPNPFHAAMQGRRPRPTPPPAGCKASASPFGAHRHIAGGRGRELSLHMAQAAEESITRTQGHGRTSDALAGRGAACGTVFPHPRPRRAGKTGSPDRRAAARPGRPMQLAAQAALRCHAAIPRAAASRCSAASTRTPRRTRSKPCAMHWPTWSSPMAPKSAPASTPCPRPARSRVPLTSWPASQRVPRHRPGPAVVGAHAGPGAGTLWERRHPRRWALIQALGTTWPRRHRRRTASGCSVGERSLSSRGGRHGTGGMQCPGTTAEAAHEKPSIPLR